MKNAKHMNLAITCAAAALAAAGCANQDFAGSTYSRDEPRTAQSVAYATITDIMNAKIEGTDGTMGGVGGGLLGGVIGNAIGGGSGRNIATVAGALAGAVAGSKVENAATSHNALQITFQYDSGGEEVVVQSAGSDHFEVGMRVSVIKSQGKAVRVRPAPAGR